MQVTLRQRLKRDKISLYLDYYSHGRRQYEYLQLYLIPEPPKGRLSKEKIEQNRDILSLAEAIRSKRHLEIQNGIYGFENKAKMKSSFLRYIESLIENRKESKGNYGNWDSALKQLQKYVKHDVTFSQIDKRWLEGFKEFLSSEARTPGNQLLSESSQSSYFNKIRAALNEAFKERIIQRNPCVDVKRINPVEQQREFLTYDELQAAAKAECELPVFKRAFLFSALTGLRFSDIQKLTWEEVQHSKELGYYIRFRQKKTKGLETLPISDQAFSLMGERGESEEQVFSNLNYSAWNNRKLKDWMKRSGITKKITFHCARHTYATLQLTLGTDIYTLKKILGHKNISTTEIYGRVIDAKKMDAAKRIHIDL